MSTFYRLTQLLVSIAFISVSCTPTTAQPPTSVTNTIDISTPYLGQTPPGLTPQVFAPGIISIPSAMDFAGTFSPDGTEFYFTRRLDGQENVIYETHLVNGAWTEPAPAAFASGYVAFEPHVTADNQAIYFGWAHSRTSEEKSTLDDGGIWAADRTADGWSPPRFVGEGMFVSSDQSGQIYVTNFASGIPSLSNVTLTNGHFTDWKNIAAGVHPAIAPDGSYLVCDDGNGNLRVRFRLEDGTWSAPKDLTKQGIPASASIASISPDGKYLFYTDKGDLYWVSTELIKNLKDE
jgi:Tol biopolymer transport system component